MANQVIFSGAPSQACNLPALLKGGVVMAMIGGIHVCTSNSFPLQWKLLLAQAGAVLIGVSLQFIKTAFTRIVIDTDELPGLRAFYIAVCRLSSFPGFSASPRSTHGGNACSAPARSS
jgi:hypothetical protein